MAAKPKAGADQAFNGLRPSRRGRRIAAWLAVIGLALLAWYWKPLSGNAVTAASYGARVACSCRYVAGRDLASCRKDFEPGMGLVMLSEDDEAKSVTARFLLLSSQTATFRAGQGCVLEKWEG